MGKFSIIIPTLQKCKPVLNLLLDELIESDEVEEIIVIDNTRRGLGRTHSKLKVVAPCENIYVNPSFNLGMEFVNCPYWGFINDDILIPKNLLSQVGEFLTSDKVGIVGLDSEISEETPIEECKTYPENSAVSFSQFSGNEAKNYFGSVIFGRKENFYKIPEELKIFYGVDYLLLKNSENYKKNFEIKNVKVKHLNSMTINETYLQDFKNNDKIFYFSHYKKEQNKTQNEQKSKINKLFSMTKCSDGRHKCTKIFGIKFKSRLEVEFPKDAEPCQKFTKKHSRKNGVGCIFAMFDKNGTIVENTLDYLKEIKKHVDYIIVVGDNPIKKSELAKLDNLVDSYVFARHGEYDFGSYKIGFEVLEKLEILGNFEHLLFANDSILYLGKPLDELFENGCRNDFYGLTHNLEGITKNYKYTYSSHLQSYLFFIKNSVFNADFFKNFIKSVKKQRFKSDVIYNYELGMSKVMQNNGIELKSFYPKTFSPETYYLNPYSSYEEKNKLFYKKYKWKEIEYFGR